MLRTIKPAILAATAAALIGFGCSNQHGSHAGRDHSSSATAGHAHARADAAVLAADMAADIKEAVAVLHGTKGNEKVHGIVRFSDTGSGIKITAEVMGLTPGEHGFHVHEFGDCTAPDATSAGGHFNPSGHKHGAPGSESHVGDMGNLKADENGNAKLEVTVPHGSITGKNGVLGRGVIVHAKADDLKTQPTGDAGGRVACGVIGVAQVKK